MENIIKAVKDNYGLEVFHGERIKNVYKLYCKEGCYSIKFIKYNLKHFNFILSAMCHLMKMGFSNIPIIIPNLKGENYTIINNHFAYINPWINARESNYDNPYDLYLASTTLGKLHKHSEGFNVNRNMKPRVGWFRWIDNFSVRSIEILDFKKRISQKAKKTEFDEMYLKLMDKELITAEHSIKSLKEADYFNIVNKDFYKRGFCHHDYAHHNVLIGSSSQVTIIDFDYCILDSYLHDVSSLMLRTMKNGKWDMEKAEFILRCYSKVNEIKSYQVPVIATFMEFPQDYWQLGIQYYWEQQQWGEEFFINKLRKIKEDIEDKAEFIKELKSYK